MYIIQKYYHLWKVQPENFEFQPAGSLSEGDFSPRYFGKSKVMFEGDFETALGLFISNIMKDRTADDDGARKAAVAVFTMLSDLHPAAKAFRRRFSMALY